MPPKVSPTELLLKQLLDFYFGRLKKIDNHRPPWLKGLEIDRYYPEIKVGIEFQGLQHYRPAPRSLGEGGSPSALREQFFDQVQRDTEKIQLAAKQGVKIIPLGLQDLTPERFKHNFKMIADAGMRVAQAEGSKRVVEILKSIRWDKDPDPSIFKRFAGVRRSRQWRPHPPQKRGLLHRILRR